MYINYKHGGKKTVLDRLTEVVLNNFNVIIIVSDYYHHVIIISYCCYYHYPSYVIHFILVM